ncbi:MAG TPA: hypothetical protein PKE58_10810, partial [Acidobacteriota bacterium]|nr:hypothetical protein [Acidobacteriota bacterium]
MAISDDEKKSVLIEICNQIQPALSQVATKARSKLTPSPGNTPGNSLAVTTNAMIGNQVAERKLKAITLEYRDDLKRLEREPFNARVVVRWADKGLLETIYVSRPSAAGILFEQPGVKLATYVSPLGRLAEFKAGARTTITIGGRQRKVTILERVILTPKIQDGEWDAIDDYFEFPQWKTEIDSILQLLKQHQPKTAPIDDISDFFGDFLDSDDQPKFRDLRKRKVIQDLSLPDQFLLDPYQGEVFRMPLNQRLILLGPPGTGKTTTLIRRLAQKRTHEALTSEELIALDNAGLGKSFLDAHSWVMFIPTDLLKNFIEKAFNRERVALNQGNLQTWEKGRLNLARNVL